MIYWRCPICKREREWHEEVKIKVCYVCQEEMEVLDDEQD